MTVRFRGIVLEDFEEATADGYFSGLQGQSHRK